MRNHTILTRFSVLLVLLALLLSLPSPSQAQTDPFNYSEQVGPVFPVSNLTVATAGDYRVNMLATAKPSGSYQGFDHTAVNYFGIYAGYTTVPLDTFIHAGLYVTHEGVKWFAAGSPEYSNAPVIECLRGNKAWFDNDNRHTGCLSDVGDLGLDLNVWTRVQLVTYNTGFWIVRIANQQGYPQDVAKIYNPNTTIVDSRVIGEESWQGANQSQNPWVQVSFYDLDLKYRTAGGWAHWPSNIGGNYGSANITESSNSGADPCPAHYGVNPYVQGNPYLWYVGSGGSTCSGLLYTGGGPDTLVISIIGEYSGKFMSSENGVGCVHTNRNIPAQWEEWHVEHLGVNVVAYRGNNGKYMQRGSGDDLFVNATGYTSANAQYDYLYIAPYVFRLRNKGNNKYVDHNNGSGCTEADVTNPGNQETFRYVAF